MARYRSLWYYPESGAAAVRVDMGWSLAELTPLPTFDRADSRDGVGRLYSIGFRGGLRVRMRRERMADRSLVAQMRAVENHLQRGRHIMVTADRSRAFTAWVASGTSAGMTTVRTGPNFFRDLLADSLALTAGDVVTIESGNPSWRREEAVVSSVTALGVVGYDIALSTALRFDGPAADGVMVRYEYAYPALYLPADQAGRPLISTENGLTWTFEAELEMNPAVFAVGLQSASLPLEPGAATVAFGPRLSSSLDVRISAATAAQGSSLYAGAGSAGIWGSPSVRS